MVEQRRRLRERKLELGLASGAAQKAAIRTKRNSNRRAGALAARHLPSYLQNRGEPHPTSSAARKAAQKEQPAVISASKTMPDEIEVRPGTVDDHSSETPSRELNLQAILRRGLTASLSYFNQVADDLRTSMRASITARSPPVTAPETNTICASCSVVSNQHCHTARGAKAVGETNMCPTLPAGSARYDC